MKKRMKKFCQEFHKLNEANQKFYKTASTEENSDGTFNINIDENLANKAKEQEQKTFAEFEKLFEGRDLDEAFLEFASGLMEFEKLESKKSKENKNNRRKN